MIERKSAAPSPNKQAWQDLETFLLALESFPLQAARQPDLTFEQHLSNVAATKQHDSRRE